MKIFLTLALLFVSVAASADEAAVQKAQKYLNSLSTFEADFTQIDAEGGQAGGKFSLQRPGKFRWEYDKRQPILIVSNGSQLVYYDKQLKEVTYTSIENSLASFLARKEIKFSGDVRLVNSGRGDGKLFVEVEQVKKPEEGKLKMIFNENPMKITGLEITDANGYVTKISFSNQSIGQRIASDTFIFKDPKFGKNVWERKKN